MNPCLANNAASHASTPGKRAEVKVSLLPIFLIDKSFKSYLYSGLNPRGTTLRHPWLETTEELTSLS